MHSLLTSVIHKNMNSSEWWFSKEIPLCGWKIRSIVGFVGNSQCERCWWADKVQWDASQAPRDLATEHLGKCGQTDESRLGALPPKGRVTFSGDNMGLQWHRKHFPPPWHSAVLWPLSFPPSLQPPLPLPPSLLISLVLSAAVTTFCLFILLQVKRLDKVPKAWRHYTREWNGWKCDWVQQRKMITDRKDTQHQVHFLKILESCSCCVCVINIQTQKGKLRTQGISQQPELLNIFWDLFLKI